LFSQESELSEVGPSKIGKTSEALHFFAARLNHVLIRKIDPKVRDAVRTPHLVRRDGEWSFQLSAVDNDEMHVASATVILKDLSPSFSPTVSETFDDVLVADQTSAIVFQKLTIVNATDIGWVRRCCFSFPNSVQLENSRGPRLEASG
jgi:hypothetical protein